jgi:hypothetical protein
MNRNEDNESPLLSIEVQLEKETVNLIINEDDIIEEKIKNFCKKYNLPDSAKEILNRQVMEQLDNQIEECKISFF